MGRRQGEGREGRGAGLRERRGDEKVHLGGWEIRHPLQIPSYATVTGLWLMSCNQ